MKEFAIKCYSWAQAHSEREEGQGVIEYALIVGLVSIVLAGVLATAGTTWINAVTGYVTGALSSANP